MTLRMGSLFAGIGGFDLALSRCGLTPAWAVEIDPQCRKVLASRFPEAALHEDVRAVGRANLMPVDVICGGFPCQDLSVAGKREGLGGARSGLFWEMARIVDELRPRVLVWENVPGLLSSDAGRDFARVLRGLADIGYRGGWRVLDARYFGVPQRRRRVFGVFARGRAGAAAAAEILALTEGVRGHPAARGEAGEGVTAGTLGGTGGGGPRSDPDRMTFVPIDMRQVSRGEKLTNNRANGSGGPPGTGVGETGDPAFTVSERGQAVASFDPRNVTSKANRTKFEYGAPAQTLHAGGLSIAHALKAEGHDGSEDGTGRGVPLVPFNWQGSGTQTTLGYDPDATTIGTLESNQTPAVASPMSVRRLTPLECCRLQGFPDDWLDGLGLSDSAKYRCLGNAVNVAVVEWIGRRLVRYLAMTDAVGA